jgi:hypothetical protein
MNSENVRRQVVQFLYLDTPVEADGIHATEQELAEMTAFIEAQLKTGVLLATEEWQPSGTGAHVPLTRDEVTRTEAIR